MRKFVLAIDGADRKRGKAQALSLKALQEHERMMIRPLYDNEAAFGLKARQTFAEFDRRCGAVFQPAEMGGIAPGHEVGSVSWCE